LIAKLIKNNQFIIKIKAVFFGRVSLASNFAAMNAMGFELIIPLFQLSGIM
jgi:hypothetical protein